MLLPIKQKFNLSVSSKNKRSKRIAQMELRFTTVTISAPKTYKGSQKQVELFAIEVSESPDSVPEKESPILWRLLTTHQVKTVDPALECVKWYKKRWFIEELFRVIKTKGFSIEASQLSSGAGLKNCWRSP